MPQLIFADLVGPSIIVRPISADDWTELFAAGSDPESGACIRCGPLHRSGFPEILRQRGRFENEFCVVERATGRLIGSSRYTARARAERVEIAGRFRPQPLAAPRQPRGQR